MTFKYKSAVREQIPLLIGLAGGTGSGKSFTAFELATGMSGGRPFGVIDTENGRAKHYADKFKFEHGEISDPFRPDQYMEAIEVFDHAKFPVIVVDSTSHIWTSILDWQEEELDRMAGTDYKKREACKMAAWIKPKTSHKKFVQKLLQVKAHVILCFRAEAKIEMEKDGQGKWQIVPKKSPTGLDGWIPICEKNLPFELTTSFLLTADAPGIPKPIKLQEQHKQFFPLNRQITAESGRAIAEWARGSQPPVASPEIIAEGKAVSEKGAAALTAWKDSLKTEIKETIRPYWSAWVAVANAADKSRAGAA